METARQRILALIFAGMFLGAETSGRTAEPPSQVPARLIPRGWEVINEITGDLNRDGRADLVIELARKDETRILNERPDEQVPRRLLVVLREGGGYRQLVSDEVLSTAAQSSAANVGTDMEVKRGSLVLTQVGGGGNSKSMTVNRYRWDGRGLAQIGFTCEGYDPYSEVNHFHCKVFDFTTSPGLLMMEGRG